MLPYTSTHHQAPDVNHLFININTSSGVPIYRQIADQIKIAVAMGELASGEKLPSVRGLSEALVINPTTVQRAFLDLERDAVIETRRGQGTFVRGDAVALPTDERRCRAAESLKTALAEARRLKLGGAELRALFETEFKKVFGNGQKAAETDDA